jgi:Protein of unknown function (DUF1091)
VTGQNKRLVLPLPALNYCDMMRGQVVPLDILNVVLDNLKQYGKLFNYCPIAPDIYYMNGFFFNETASPLTRMLRPGYKYMVKVIMTDENLKKAMSIFSVQVFFSKSNR